MTSNPLFISLSQRTARNKWPTAMCELLWLEYVMLPATIKEIISAVVARLVDNTQTAYYPTMYYTNPIRLEHMNPRTAHASSHFHIHIQYYCEKIYISTHINTIYEHILPNTFPIVAE